MTQATSGYRGAEYRRQAVALVRSGHGVYEVGRELGCQVNDDDHDSSVTLGLLSLEELLSLGHDLGLEEAGAGAQIMNDGDVEAAVPNAGLDM